ncbi:MAG: glycosyltransferase family 39 protein [Kiritimatiellia bacterium]
MGPLLTAMSAYFLGRLVRLYSSDGMALLAAALYAISPLTILIGASFMNHISAQFYVILGIWLAVSAVRRPTLFRGLFAGFALGMGAITRPQDMVLLLPLLFFFLLAELKNFHFKEPGFRGLILAFIAGAAIPLTGWLMWNHVQYGFALHTGYGRPYSGQLIRYYSPAWGFDDNFGVKTATAQFIPMLLRYNQAALGWPAIFPFMLLALFNRRRLRITIALVICFAVVPFFFWAYHYYGYEFECRFYHVIHPVALILAALGLQNGYGILQKRFNAETAKLATTLLILTCLFYAAAYYWPIYLFPRYSQNYEEVDPRIHKTVAASGIANAVVVIDATYNRGNLYSSVSQFNDPEIEKGPIIYARKGNNLDCLKSAYPQREFFETQLIENSWTIIKLP